MHSNPKIEYHAPKHTSTIDYYPFGQEMPGRVYSQTSYRYGFNGKENDNEVAGTGNWQNYGMREYDARVARFISCDRYKSKFAFNSPYNFVITNPIVALDNGGDSTIYYTESGRLLFIAHDNLDNALVVIDDDDIINFATLGMNAMKYDQEHTDNINIQLRMKGKEYVIADFINYGKLQKEQKVFDGYGKLINKYEKSSYLYDNNGRIIIGKKYAIGGANIVTDEDREKAELIWEGSVSKIHDHPNAGENPLLILGPYKDSKNHPTKDVYMDALVEYNSQCHTLYFYNNKTKFSIKIRPNTFKKEFNATKKIRQNLPSF